MSLDDLIGRRKFLKTASGLLVLTGTGNLLSACGDEITSEQCREGREWNGEECVAEPDADQDTGYDVGREDVQEDPVEDTGSEILLYDDFRSDSGLWNITERGDNPSLIYTNGGLEMRDQEFSARQSYSENINYHFEAKWKLVSVDDVSHFYFGMISMDTNHVGVNVLISPSFYPDLDLTQWHTTKFVFDKTRASFYLDNHLEDEIDQSPYQAENDVVVNFGCRTTGLGGRFFLDYIELSKE